MRFKAYVYAWRGIVEAFRKERNFRVHLVAAEVVLYLAFSEQVRPPVLAGVVALIAFVLSLELVNTAIERTMDLAHPQRHPIVAAAKDAAAGAVLLAALGAAAAGVLLLGPKLPRVHPWQGGWQLLGLVLLVIVALLTLWRAPRGQRHQEL